MGTRSRYISNFVVSSNDIANNTIAFSDLGDIYTSNIIEDSNLYYTNARVYANTTALLATGVTLGNVIITGNLTIQGNTTIVNSEEIFLADNQIILNSNHSGVPTQDAGLIINRGSSSNVALSWNESTNKWTFTNDGTTYYNLPTSTSDVAEGTNLYYTNARVYSNVITLLNDKANVVDLTTANITELNNLYFTNTRARAAISVTGSGSYDSANGIINVTGGVTSVNDATGAVVVSTANIAESGNLYFTNTRAISAFTAASGINIDANGVIGISGSYNSAMTFSNTVTISGNLIVTNSVVQQSDIGTGANEIPLNQYLGMNAYVDTETPALNVGTGITTGTGTICRANGGLSGGIYRITILIDLTGLNSGGTAGDIIGVNGTALPCYIAQLPAITVLGGRMTCLETPAGGDTDIDLYVATEATGVEDQAVSALTETEIINAGAQTRGTVTYFSADPVTNGYLYLVGQGTANATYTAGRFLIEIFGVQ